VVRKSSNVPRPPSIPPSTSLLAGVAIAFGVAGTVDLQVVVLVVLAAVVFGWGR
jgi:hypothetical protein